jgi:hypothetical protein
VNCNDPYSRFEEEEEEEEEEKEEGGRRGCMLLGVRFKHEF